MFKASVQSKGDSVYLAETRDGRFVMATNGQDSNPVDALLASLCACMGHHTKEFIQDNKIRCGEYSLKAEADLSQDKSRVANIRVSIGLSGPKLSDTEKAGLLQRVMLCHIYGSLKPGSEIAISIE